MPLDIASSLSAVASGKADWAVMIALGAFHGINPGMGWLFAVALGIRSAAAVQCCWRSCHSLRAMRWP